jgi:hypothetical protein
MNLTKWTTQTETKKIPPATIVIFGRSIGSGPSVDLASKLKANQLAGLVLQSPLESGGKAVRKRRLVLQSPLESGGKAVRKRRLVLQSPLESGGKAAGRVKTKLSSEWELKLRIQGAQVLELKFGIGDYIEFFSRI